MSTHVNLINSDRGLKMDTTCMTSALSFEQLRDINHCRCCRWHPQGERSWSLSEWALAAIGELGEVCNVIKKLNRASGGLKGNKETEEELKVNLAKEIADTLIYLDLLAAAAGINLETAVIAKFNEVSARNDFPERIEKVYS